jgi:hypothetical protein
MKVLAAIITLTVAGALLSPVVAEYPLTKADCVQAGMKWMKATNTCVVKSQRTDVPEQARLVLGLIGIGSGVLGLLLLWRIGIAERGT